MVLHTAALLLLSISSCNQNILALYRYVYNTKAVYNGIVVSIELQHHSFHRLLANLAYTSIYMCTMLHVASVVHV